MSWCAKRGYIDVQGSDGRWIRIIYVYEDDKCTADRLKAEVVVLKAFAAAYTRGDAVSAMTILYKVYNKSALAKEGDLGW